MNVRIDGTNERLDTLARRVVESEVRTSTAITDLAGTVREMTSVLRTANDLRPRLERCEQDIAEIKRSGSAERETLVRAAHGTPLPLRAPRSALPLLHPPRAQESLGLRHVLEGHPERCSPLLRAHHVDARS